MKKALLCFLLPFFFLLNARAQTVPDTVEVAIRFGSICCGPDSDIFLKDFYKGFNKGKCRKVLAYKAGGCGKEGEFFILFSLKKLKLPAKEKFKSSLEEIITKENLKNKAANSSAGGIMIQQNIAPARLSYCRIPLAKW